MRSVFEFDTDSGREDLKYFSALHLHAHFSMWSFDPPNPSSPAPPILKMRDWEGSCCTYQRTEPDFQRILQFCIPARGRCTLCYSCSGDSRRCAWGWAPRGPCWGAWAATTPARWSGTRARPRTRLESSSILVENGKSDITGDCKHSNQFILCLIYQDHTAQTLHGRSTEIMYRSLKEQ